VAYIALNLGILPQRDILRVDDFDLVLRRNRRE
jgi:hypothetical protein